MIDPTKDTERYHLGGRPPATSRKRPEEQPKSDVFERFQALSGAQRILFWVSIATLLGFVVERAWGVLTSPDNVGFWFVLLAIIGSIGTLTLLSMRLLKVPMMAPSVHARVVLLVAMLPAVGLLIELLSHFWAALMMVGAGAMAYVCVREFTRPAEEEDPPVA